MEFNPGVAPHISCIAVNSEICLLATRLNNVLDATFVKEWYLLYKLKGVDAYRPLVSELIAHNILVNYPTGKDREEDAACGHQ